MPHGPVQITRRHLFGLGGISLGLPFLSSFEPRAAWAGRASRPLRFVVVFHGQGTLGERWLPKAVGPNYELSPLLAPLRAFQSKLCVVSGIDNKVAASMGGNGHNRAGRSLLTCQPFSKGGENGLALGPSIDQVLAEQIRENTRLKSLALNVGCDIGEYQLLFAKKDDPVTGISDPRIAFDLLFSALPSSARAAPANVREQLKGQRASVLDAVLGDLRRLQAQLPNEDRQRLELHAEKIRELERMLGVGGGSAGAAGAGGAAGVGGAGGTGAAAGHGGSSGGGRFAGAGGAGALAGGAGRVGRAGTGSSAGAGSTAGTTGNSCRKPVLGLDTNIDECAHAHELKLAEAQIRNLALALACDVTRVATLQFLEYDGPTFPWLNAGIPGEYNNWHALIHRDGGTKAARDEMAFAGFSYYSQQLAFLLTELNNIEDGPGMTLLDNTLVLWISEFGEGGTHDTSRLPVVLAGGLAGRIRTGEHRAYANRSTNDLYVTLLNLFGINARTFGYGGADLNQGLLSELIA